MRIGLNSPQAFLALIVRRKWWIIAPFVALSCMVAVLAKNLPKVYVSESLILVRPREIPANFVPDLIAGSTEERLKSIEQTVLSRTNLIAIIREFGDQLPELQRLNMEAKVTKLRAQIATNFSSVTVKGEKQINYFRISYQNQNPVLAQKIASKLTLLFIEKDGATRENQVAGTRDFFARELERVAADLSASDARLKQMRSSRQFELPERLDMNLKKLELLGQDARTVEESIGRIVTQRLTNETLLNETPPVLIKPFAGPPPAAEDPKIGDFRKAKLAYETETAVKPPQNNDVRVAKAALDKARARLSPEELKIAENPPAAPVAPVSTPAAAATSTPPGTEPNPRYQSLTASLSDLETEYKIQQNRKKAIADDIATFSRRVESTPQIEQELADVLRENKDLQKEYDDLKSKLSAAELSASLENQQKAGQFQVVDPANLPVTPAKPNKSAVTMAGSALSLVLSLIFAIVVDIARQRIWTKTEIETFWGVPVLVDLPAILTDSDMTAARRKNWIFAASAAAAAMVLAVGLYGMHLKHDFILRQLDPVLQEIVYK